MPITCCPDCAARILRSRGTGIVSADEIVDHLKAKEQRHVLACPELFDARDARFDLSIPDLHRIVDEMRRVMAGAKPGPIAVVTNSNFIRGLARACASVSVRDNPAFEIFDDVKNARNWLDRSCADPAYAPGTSAPVGVRKS